MKCQACGFTEDENKEFITSSLSVSYEIENWPYSNNVVTTVYICPSCGTLKIIVE